VTLPVIVTRSQPGARETADNLAAQGFAPILSPMLQIVETGFDPAALTGVRHLILTSVNGLNALREVTFAGDLRVWCVGPSTAGAARAAGFADVIEGRGNAEDLARLILASGPEGPLLHVANEAAAGNLVATLRAAGLDARFAAPYRTDPAPALSAPACAALSGPGPVILLVHSAKAAAAVSASAPDLRNAALVAISEAASAPLADQAGRGEWIAGHPDEDGLTRALQQARAALLR
jgi:uroporphyrinogen-III synthase